MVRVLKIRYKLGSPGKYDYTETQVIEIFDNIIVYKSIDSEKKSFIGFILNYDSNIQFGRLHFF